MTRWLIIGSALFFSFATWDDRPTGPILVVLIHALTWHLHVIEVKINKLLDGAGIRVWDEDINRD